jgi:hypothetical protein
MPIPGEFYDKRQVKAVLLVVLNAAVLLACGPLAYHLNRWWAYAIAFILVGARAQALSGGQCRTQLS